MKDNKIFDPNEVFFNSRRWGSVVVLAIVGLIILFKSPESMYLGIIALIFAVGLFIFWKRKKKL